MLDAFISGLRGDGVRPRTLNFGGGFGIAYRDSETPLDVNGVARLVTKLAADHDLKLILEPGRYLVGPAGSLVTRVEYIKTEDTLNGSAGSTVIRDILIPVREHKTPVF